MSTVKIPDPPEAPLGGFRDGVYAVAGQFSGEGMDGTLGVWAASSDMLRTGGGLIIGADSVTREFSDLGVPRLLAVVGEARGGLPPTIADLWLPADSRSESGRSAPLASIGG